MKRIPCNKGYSSRGKLDIKQQRYYLKRKKKKTAVHSKTITNTTYGDNGVKRHFQQYSSYIVVVSFISGGNRSTRRKPPTCCKLLTNLWATRALIRNRTCIRCSTIYTKEAVHFEHNGFPLPPEYECRKRNSLYPIRTTSFVSIVMYLTSCGIMIL